MAEPRRRRLLLKILLAVGLVLAVAVVAAYWYLRPLLLTATGYAAHNACAVEHISGRSDAASDLPSNPLVPYLRTTGNQDGSVSASVLGVLARQTAWYTEGHGCTLADARPDLPPPSEIAEPNPLLAAPAPAGTPDAVAAAIDAAFATDSGTRAVVVVRDGELVAERYADGFTADTPQLGWSLAKSATNLVVGRAVQEHGFDLDADTLVEGWSDGRAAITPDHLMRMTSGLVWDETYDLGTPITAMLYLEEDMGAFMRERELAREVGEYFQYSSGSTNLLCSVLLDAVGGDTNTPRELLLEPLGLPSAQWEPDAAGTPVCGSYLWATPREWAAIGQFALDDGVVAGESLLPEGWMAEATTPTVAELSAPTSYGAGWWLNQRSDGTLESPELPADAYWGNGHDGQRLYVVPSEDLVVVRMGFSPNRGDAEMGTKQLVADLVEARR